MSTAPVPAPSKFDFGASLDVLARSTATLLLVMYGVGFVILAAYEAKFGVVQFGPLRARIFLVGFVFTALSALPIAAHHYNFSYFNQITSVMENKDPALQSERAVILACAFVFTAYLMAMASIFGFFFPGPNISANPPHVVLRLGAWVHRSPAVLFWLQVGSGRNLQPIQMSA